MASIVATACTIAERNASLFSETFDNPVQMTNETSIGTPAAERTKIIMRRVAIQKRLFLIERFALVYRFKTLSMRLTSIDRYFKPRVLMNDLNDTAPNSL